MMQVDKRDDKKRVKAATQVGVGWVGWWWGFLQGPCKLKKTLLLQHTVTKPRVWSVNRTIFGFAAKMLSNKGPVNSQCLLYLSLAYKSMSHPTTPWLLIHSKFVANAPTADWLNVFVNCPKARRQQLYTCVWKDLEPLAVSSPHYTSLSFHHLVSIHHHKNTFIH